MSRGSTSVTRHSRACEQPGDALSHDTGANNQERFVTAAFRWVSFESLPGGPCSFRVDHDEHVTMPV